MSQHYGPYSPIRQAGGLYFIAGQVGINPETKVVSADVSEQTKQALDNMQQVCAEQGLSLHDIVKTTIFLADMHDFAAVNEVYERFFVAPRPARSTVQVARLPKLADVPLRIEIEAVAYQEPA